MRLIIKQNGRTAEKLQFDEGPIRIGRKSDSHIFLRNKAVSKEHAVIYATNDGQWMVEDMKSANKTYLNKKTVQKASVKTGDCLRISDIIIEINLDGENKSNKTAVAKNNIQMEATLAIPAHETIVRKPDAEHAPAMRLGAGRLTDFSQATELINSTENLEQLLDTMVNVTLKQFAAYHSWCGIREQPGGQFNYHKGKRRDGKAVELDSLELKDKINQTVEKGRSMVLPRVSAQLQKKAGIRSAMIAAIVRPTGCMGVIYVDNAMIHEHYGLSDLDYLMLIAIHTAATLKKLLNL